jgi:hypothetical protein
MSKVDLRVDWCSYQAAKFAVMNWHYSKRVPHGQQQYIGVWENEIFTGAICLGRSITPYLGSPYGLTQHECAELTRVALNKHSSPVSEIVSKVIKQIRAKSPGLRLLVSYADPLQGHNGSIYQAMNWIYDGNAGERRQWLIDGKWRNDTHTYRMSKAQRDKYKTRIIPQKYRYLYPLDRAMRKQIAPLAKPYPKRETCGQSVEGDTIGDQSIEVGSIPTGRSE